MERHDPAGPEMADERAQRPSGIAEIHQHESTDDRIKARRTHYEDWIAAIVFNHLFSGADAYVAANLWDFKANIGVVAAPRGAGVRATLAFK